MTPEKALNTKQAAQYFKEKWGTPFKPGSMEVWRCQGRGPEFFKVCNRVFYRPSALDAFAAGTVFKTVDSGLLHKGTHV